MGKIHSILISCFVFVFIQNIFSQQLPIAGAGLAVKGIISLVGGNKEKKQEKTINNSVTPTKINGTTVTILRVKTADIKSKAKTYIISIQNKLDIYAGLCKSNSYFSIPKKDSDIYHIQTIDSDWPTDYYESELKAYKKYVAKLEQHTKDSIAAINNTQTKHISDSLVHLTMPAKDSFVPAVLKTNYNYINKAFTIVKDSPMDKAQTLGVLFVGSYVTIINPADNAQFIKVTFHGMEGYVDKAILVDDINKITVANADLNTYKKSIYCRYVAKPKN